MDPLGLHAQSIVRRARETGFVGSIPSPSRSLLIGTIGFLTASLVVFATVAFGERWMYRTFGLSGAYLIWTTLFIAIAGSLLSRLVLGPGRFQRFFVLFTAAFLLYAIGWIAAYFVIRGAGGEIAGSLAGTALMAGVICIVFGRTDKFLTVLLILFVGNSIGYFLGRLLNDSFQGRLGMLMWGVCFGIGLGAALGKVFYEIQSHARELLRDPFATST